MTRRRLDQELVRRGLFESKDQAQLAISNGSVTVSGAIAEKSTRLVDSAEPINLAKPAQQFVSRGGMKLESALEHFSLDVVGKRALDVGSSTGGFTDCLLQRGISQVVAVDVGKSQLHERIRQDKRVRALEGTNIRNVELQDLGGVPFDVVVADLSFISLRLVAPILTGEIAKRSADIVTLIKPQFEATKREASKGGGVIQDPAVWRHSLVGVADSFSVSGAPLSALTLSPLLGAEGNVEFLGHFRLMGGGNESVELAHELEMSIIDQAVSDARLKIQS